MIYKKRMIEIDCLRGFAVIFVMFRHFHSHDYKIKIPMLESIGWIGVDMFFVLSGFLISSLLYKELDKNGKINFKRFFIRRGFKIYPSFFFLIFIVLIIKIYKNGIINYKELVAECLFLQSYFKGILVHSWTLGIEEHFYILLPLMLISYSKISSKNLSASNFINLAFLFISISCLTIRCYNTFQYEFNIYKHIFNTHIRIDSLFFGVFLSYHYNYHYTRLKLFVLKYHRILALFCFAILVFIYLNPIESPFITSVGFTLLYIFFGIVLLMVLFVKDIVKFRTNRFIILYKPIAFIGFYSYTIYLWHIPVEGFISRMELYYKYNILFVFVFYAIFSTIAGYTASKLIETPTLKIREKYFKSV